MAIQTEAADESQEETDAADETDESDTADADAADETDESDTADADAADGDESIGTEDESEDTGSSTSSASSAWDDDNNSVMPEELDWNHYVDLLVVNEDPEDSPYLVIYAGEEEKVQVDYTQYCSEEDVKDIYWCEWTDGCLYSLEGVPFTEVFGAYDDYIWESESPYLSASPTDNGIILSSKGIEWSDDSLWVLVLCTDGDYYFDFLNYETRNSRTESYRDADILNYRTKSFDESYLYVEEGESCHLDLDYSGYCTADEVESVTIRAWNDLTGEDGRIAFTEDNMPQFEFTRDATGWTITGRPFENDMPWVFVEVYVKLKTGAEGLYEGFYLEQVDPDNIAEGFAYDKNLHYIFESDSIEEDAEGKNAETGAEAKNTTAVKQNTAEENPASPKTGDTNHAELWLILAAAGTAGICLNRRKSKGI